MKRKSRKSKSNNKKKLSPGDPGYIDQINQMNNVSSTSYDQDKKIGVSDLSKDGSWIGIIIIAAVMVAIGVGLSGNIGNVFSGKGLLLFAGAIVLVTFGVITSNNDDVDKRKKERIKKASEANKPKEKANVSSDTVTKSTEAPSGTAFFVDDKGHVITNNHVIQGFENRAKIYYDNENIKLKFIAKDEQLDLALLKANVKNEDYIEIPDKIVRKMQSIVAAGYPFGKYLSDDLKFTSGIVSSLKGPGNNSAIIQIDAALNPGNSGGPIVDKENGNLAGVAVAGLRKDMTESINYGIKASRVKDFLESNRVNIKSKNNKSEKIDVGELLENATVYISCD